MPLELIAGAVVGVAAASPKIRKALRKGVVYGLAGALVAYDNVAAMAAKARNLRKPATGAAETEAPGATSTPAAAAQPASASTSPTS